jgi:hypothetical protein
VSTVLPKLRAVPLHNPQNEGVTTIAMKMGDDEKIWIE